MTVISYNIPKVTQSWKIKKCGKRESEREREKKEDQKSDRKRADREEAQRESREFPPHHIVARCQFEQGSAVLVELLQRPVQQRRQINITTATLV